MTITTTPIVFLKSHFVPGRLFKLISTVLLVSTLVACAAAPTKPTASRSTTGAKDAMAMSGAASMYNTRNFSGAIREFDKIIKDSGSSANSRRTAHLGKSMVYLGNDKKWHSIENAKMSLISAGKVTTEDGEEFSVETDLLMDAVSSVIGTESKYNVLMSKSSWSGAQNAELQSELETITGERDELLKEQKMLNEAIEKLKELTLGN